MEQEKLLEFANKINMEALDMMLKYNTITEESEKENILNSIKIRLDVLLPLREMEYKRQQLVALEEMKNSDFAKNFNIKDIIGALKNIG